MSRGVAPVVRHANYLRTERDEVPILTHVTPHTFRRSYITFMLAAGFDLPYVQDQVGHVDPTTTLKIYAKVIRRPDREAVRAEMLAVLGEDGATAEPTRRPSIQRPNGREGQQREALER